MNTKITVLLDRSRYEGSTTAALLHAAGAVGMELDVRVVRTSAVDDALVAAPGSGVVIGPGTPYNAPEAAEAVVSSCRERGVPLVGT